MQTEPTTTFAATDMSVEARRSRLGRGWAKPRSTEEKARSDELDRVARGEDATDATIDRLSDGRPQQSVGAAR